MGWIGLIADCCIGLADESLKVLLPGREFTAADLIKDAIDVGVAFLLF